MKLSALALPVAVSMAALTLGPAATASASTRPDPAPKGAISIADYGAIPGDQGDDLAAIVRTVAAAKAAHERVYVPRGTYLYSDLIVLDGVSLVGAGSASVLKATSAANQAVELTGRGASVSSVSLTTVPVTQRLSTDVSARVFVDPSATSFAVHAVSIDGSSSAGIIAFGSKGTITQNHVANTLADGIHVTGASNGVVIEGNRVENTGDDQIAVVSYEKNAAEVKNVAIVANTVSGGHARGITVSGGDHIAIEANRVSDTGGAGIYLASEGSYRTYAVTNIHVAFNTITGDGRNASVPEQGGIRLQGTYKEPSIHNALIEYNVFRDSASDGVLIVGTSSVDAVFRGNTIDKPAGYGIRIVSSVIGTLSFSRNKVTGSGQAPFSNASSAQVTSDQANDPDAGSGPTDGTFLAANGTPVIDGTVDALWSNATPLAMNVDANGTTGTARVAWDDDNLYFLFQMTDTTPFTVGQNENNDSVEAWVDELDARNGTRTTGDYQLRVDRAGTVSTDIDGLDVSGIRKAVIDRPDGYTVEFAVPYRALRPAVGDVIGFNASANDDSNGDGARDTYISWVDKNLPYYADTRDYGSVTLAAGN